MFGESRGNAFYYTDMKYDVIVDYLVETVGAACTGLGDGDNSVSKGKEATMCDFFERYISGREWDDKRINQYILVAEGDIPYIYNGKYYERAGEIDLRSIVKRVMEKIGIGVVYRQNSHIKIAHECLESLICNPQGQFNPDRRYIVFTNGVLDSEENRMLSFSPDYVTDIVLDFPYKKDFRLPLWDGFVKATIPDDGMRVALQMFTGGFLIDRNRFKIEYICYLVGGGCNGKSVLTGAIAGVFGKNLVSAYSPEQLFKSSQSMYYLADISGKLANICDDMSNKDVSGGDFKLLVSGAQFPARFPWGRPFIVTRVPLLLCNVNDIPPTTDDSNGHFRRQLPIICPNQIKEKDKDPQLTSKLATKDAKAAIFNWIYEGYKALVAENGKIEICQSIREVQDDIKEQSNSVRRWVKENGYMAVEPNGAADPRWRMMKDIMTEYKGYCHDYSEIAKSPKAVSKVLRDLGVRSKRCSNTTWYCLGIGSVPIEGSAESTAVSVPKEPEHVPLNRPLPGIDTPASLMKDNGIKGAETEEDLPF